MSSQQENYHSTDMQQSQQQPQQQPQLPLLPHQGRLRRLHGSLDGPYALQIVVRQDNDSQHSHSYLQSHDLPFDCAQMEFASRLFSILDVDNTARVSREAWHEFCTLRCPVLQRRDADLQRQWQQQQQQQNATTTSRNATSSTATTGAARTTTTSTFDEIWQAVLDCDANQTASSTTTTTRDTTALGLEGWLCLLRFLSLAQFETARQKFAARHLQQTMKHRGSYAGGGSDSMVVVQVPPPLPPTPLTPACLVDQAQLELPELDLDHSSLAALVHDCCTTVNNNNSNHYTFTRVRPGHVQVQLFGSGSGSGSAIGGTAHTSASGGSGSSSSGGGGNHHGGSGSGNKSTSASMQNLEFVLQYSKTRQYSQKATMYDGDSSSNNNNNNMIVRRNMRDILWLDDSLQTQAVLGGTLCGRILPTLELLNKKHQRRSTVGSSYNSLAATSSSVLSKTTAQAAKSAVQGVHQLKQATKSAALYLWNAGSTNASTGGSSGGSGGSNKRLPSGTNKSSATNENQAAQITTKSSVSSSKPPTSNSAQQQRRHVSTTNAAAAKSFTDAYPTAQRQARQLERYLNYLLEHPALSTSFPLNTILMASQSGLDAAKRVLADCAAVNQEIRNQTPRGGDILTSTLSSVSSSSGGSGSHFHHHHSLDWVRTAAQAAIALKIHGMLETTGMPAASARLQHASLPVFYPSLRRQQQQWDQSTPTTITTTTRSEADGIDDSTSARGDLSHATSNSGDAEIGGFEDGVVQVSSELRRRPRRRDGVEFADYFDEDEYGNGNLKKGDQNNEVDGGQDDDDDDGYDLLPLPVPAPERRILMAGSTRPSSSSSTTSATAPSTQEERFHYGTSTSLHDSFLFGKDEDSTVLIGTLSIDDNIDKLREVIGSVDNTLRRCLASGGGIGKVRRDRHAVQLDVVKGFDGWEGMRGQFISQRSLLNGVKGLEQSKEIYEEGDLVLIDDLSWQSSLARSAVSAAEDVRSAVRASNTAANAKAAASNAAMSAQNACESGNFANIEEARAAQTRASIAQSQAIHAAVVDHEAKSVKRRAAVALANDLKCWNVHRKRELLKSTLSYARAQHKATKQAVAAWSCLRDGYIGSVVMPPVYDQHAVTKPSGAKPGMPVDFFGDGLDAVGTAARYRTEQLLHESIEVSAKIFGTSPTGESSPIVAVDHDLLNHDEHDVFNHPAETEQNHENDSEHDCFHQPSETELDIFADPPSYDFSKSPNHSLLEAPSELARHETEPHLDIFGMNDFSDDEASKSSAAAFYETSQTLLPMTSTAAAPIPEESDDDDNNIFDDDDDEATEFHDSETNNAVNPMTASMQSLVDGLMNWGGGLDLEEELVLPRGMAASIAFDSA